MQQNDGFTCIQLRGSPASPPSGSADDLAVDETVILLHPPSPTCRRFNTDGEGMSAK